MLQNMLDIISSLGTTPLEMACLVVILEKLIYKPLKWFYNKYFKGVLF